MTTELEQEFFKAFEIEKIKYCKNFKYIKGKCERPNSKTKCFDCIGTNEEYPEITDRKLLEMICILNSYYTRTMQCCTMLYSSKIDNLKEEILKEFIDILKQYTELEFLEKDRDEREEEDWIKTKIQQLFKEEK